MRDQNFEFYIDHTFKVPNVGIVVSGVISKGAISIEGGSGPEVWLGPFDKSGTFRKVQIRSIHTKSVLVENVYAGQSATFAIKPVKSGKAERTLRQNSIKKGMVLLGINKESPQTPPKATEKFVAQMLILKHPTTIRTGYQPLAHIRTIRQTVSLENMNADCLRTGQSGRIQFKFLHKPEYINPGDHMIFREGQCRGIGVIRRLIHDEEELKQTQKAFEKRRKERKAKERVKNNVRPEVLPKKDLSVTGKAKTETKKKGSGK
jgi:GTPase